MRYIIAYQLRRKNARRKILYKFKAENAFLARSKFMTDLKEQDHEKKVYELLTGDWKHICFYKGDDENGTS